jgi:hypothetical protein
MYRLSSDPSRRRPQRDDTPTMVPVATAARLAEVIERIVLEGIDDGAIFTEEIERQTYISLEDAMKYAERRRGDM